MIKILRPLLTIIGGCLLSVSLMAQPANDDCANAMAIGSVTDMNFTTIDATTDGPYHPAACTGGTADSLFNDVWYLFTADFDGVAEFTTCGTADFDTNIAVYGPGATCTPTVDDLITCNEDTDGCDGYTSSVLFAVETGETFLLRIGGWGSSSPGEEGTGTFTVGPYPIPNDNCADAIEIGSVTDELFVTVGATTDGPYHPAACTGGTNDSLYYDVWYLFTADFNGPAQFSTCGTASFDTNIAVYEPGSPCPPEADDVIACNEDDPGCDGYTSFTTFTVVSGESYLLRIGGWGNASNPGESGFGTFTVGAYSPPGGPPNDDCANAIAIGSVTDEDFSTVGATTDGPYHPLACTGGAADSLYNDIWYEYTADFDGVAEFTTCGTANFDTNIAVYGPGASCTPTEDDLITCNEDDDSCAGYTSKVVFAVEQGETFLLRIGGWGSSGGPGESGAGTFTVGPFAVPNDDCDDAIQVGSVTGMDFVTWGATTDGPYHPADCEGGTADSLFNDIWYQYTADFDGLAGFSTCGSANFDTNVAVYGPGASCTPTAGDLVACSEDATGCDGYTSLATFDVTNGQIYLLRIGGWGDPGGPGESGLGTFSIGPYTPPGGPPNDDCSGAIVLDLGPTDSVVVDFNSLGATSGPPVHDTGTPFLGCLEPGEPIVYNDIWWVWTATFTGWVEYSNCGLTNFDSKIAVYGPNPTCPPDVESLIACGDDTPGCANFTSLTSFPVEEDSTYYFRLGGFSGSGSGTGQIQVRKIPPPIPPPNDNCMEADTAWVTSFATMDDLDPVFQGFTFNGGSEPANPVPTCMAGNEFGDVWYKFNSGENTELTIRIFKFNSTSQFVLDLFDDCMNPTDPMTGPGFCYNTTESPLDFIPIELENFPGVPTEYYLRISSDYTLEEPGEFFFQILGEPYTGTEEVLLENFRFFPNPATDQVNVQFDLDQSKTASVEIYNTLGQLSQRTNYDQLPAGSQQLQVSVGDLLPGVYFFRLRLEDGYKTVRFVKE